MTEGRHVAGSLRIGVWCDYGVTLTPTEGIGVFVWNLVGGLLELDEPLEVIMLVAPGDQYLVEDLRKRFPGRLHVVPPVRSRLFGLPVPAQLLQSWIRLIARIRRKIQGLNRRMAFYRATLASQDSQQPLTKIQIGMLHGLEFLQGFSEKTLAACLSALDVPAFRAIHHQWAATFHPSVVARNADCDVWLIPSNRFRYPLTFPSVLVIHDLVHVHYPDAVPDDVRWELEKLVPTRAEEATLCACMSRYIRDTDLYGMLNLPSEQVRLIRSAPPADFPRISETEARVLKPKHLTRPYLFYPAAFRSYKNHVALIDALGILRSRMGEDSLDLVFTGIHGLPRELARRIDGHGLGGRVHVLGSVDRRELRALYRCAFATIVPSLYEQGSFPIYEAIHGGCPVACSNIPSLVEQCQPLGDAMIYFDPHDPKAIAQAILHIRDHRESIRARQQTASRMLWQRTWRDAARDWLHVFGEAIELANHQRLRHCA
jgi:glycosyltransferase involved in cell wall biosynthesis